MSAQNTLACNGAHRLSLLIQQDIQPATLRCIFNDDWRWHLSIANSL